MLNNYYNLQAAQFLKSFSSEFMHYLYKLNHQLVSLIEDF